MGGIFVSYRRDDAKHAAGRLVDRLGRTYHRSQLFLDVDNVAPGLDFVKVLSDQVQQCDVLLAVIGPGWIESRDGTGARRLDSPKDFVRIEIEAALARDIRVIPVLVDGAAMPSDDDLPPSLQPMVTRNAVRLVHERFAADAEDLTRALTKVVAPRRWVWGRSTAAGAASTDERPFLERPVAIPFVMAGLGAVSGLLSAAFDDPLPFLTSTVLWVHGISPLAGIWFGVVLAFGIWKWGSASARVAPLLLLTTHAAWQLSILSTNALGNIEGFADSFIGASIAILSWGGLGAVLSWAGAALICPRMRSAKWAALCCGVGAAALYVTAVLGMNKETSNLAHLLTNGYSFWQACVAAVFGMFWYRASERALPITSPAREA
jgi:hypothetical protein